MKNNILLILMSVLTGLAACSKIDFAELNKPAEPLAITTSENLIVLKEKQLSNDAIELSWTAGSNKGTNASISYTLELAREGSGFADPVRETLGNGTYSRKITVAALNNYLLGHFNSTPGVETGVEARVVAQTNREGIDPEISPAIVFKVVPFAPVSTTLFIIGDATTAGWELSEASELEPVPNQPGVFQWTGFLSDGAFKFITSRESLLPAYVKGASEAAVLFRTEEAQPDHPWEFTGNGNYTITIDIIDLSFNIEPARTPPFSRLWIVGDATPKGWNIDAPNEMSVDSSNLFVFNFNEVLNAGEFKIPTSTGNWGADFYMPLSNHPPLTSTSVQFTPNGNPDNKWLITNPGPYKIKLDLFDQTIRIEPFVPYTQLWLVGDATPAGWNIDNPTPMDAVPGDPYTFTWTGPLTAGEFKIPTTTGNWGCDYFMPLVADQGIHSRLAKFVEAGNPDHKWRVAIAGNYKITFNQLKERIEIIKQ